MGNYNRKVNEMDFKDEKDGFMSVQEDEELPFEQTDLWSLSGRAHLYTLARGVSQKGASFEEFLPIIMCFYIAIANLNENIKRELSKAVPSFTFSLYRFS